ncbi:hypothetical protein SO802_023112 [Lithocarpus litseifolius]|uniref:Uncharacterized protein n=1 Tax=Lithocarpus litseifolius TaxID=425828 RepID=A0AAW2C986_9ROSI
MPTSGQRHTPVHDHTMEEASQTADEMCLKTGYDMGSMAHDNACPSYTFAHGDTSRSSSTSSTISLLPTIRTSPPPTTSTAPTDVRGRDEMRFMPTPGADFFSWNVGKLEGDHKNAKVLAEESSKHAAETLSKYLQQRGILVMLEGPSRIVLDLQISESDVQYTLSCFQQALTGVPDQNGI